MPVAALWFQEVMSTDNEDQDINSTNKASSRDACIINTVEDEVI